YTLSWRVVSADGHPVGGSLRFSLQSASQGATTQALLGQGPSPILIWLLKAGSLFALFAAIGLFAWQAVDDAPCRSRRAGVSLLALAALLILANLATVGLDALGQPIAAVWNGDVWQAAGRTSAGLSAALALVCVGVALLGWFA